MSNVISLFNKKQQKEKEAELVNKEEASLEEIAEANRKNKERLAKERNKANKDVLRSYRIKD